MDGARIEREVLVSALIHQRVAPIERERFQRHARGYSLTCSSDGAAVIPDGWSHRDYSGVVVC